MAIFVMVAVRDRVADVFNTPYSVPHVGMAVRSFSDEVNRADEANMLYKHPDDFDLYQIGTYDDSTAMITQDVQPRQLVLGRDCKAKGNGNAS